MKAFGITVIPCESDALLANKLGLPKFDVKGVQFLKFQACKQYTVSFCLVLHRPIRRQTNRRKI